MTLDFWKSSEPPRADADYMHAALALARRGLGRTAENPAVGALIVRDGVIVGQGWTQDGGRPHAERVALDAAGGLSRGATMYVTLEPCSHHGKTPPCASAIAAAGVVRVVSALEDPDPRVAGQGHDILRRAGIEVVTGVCADEALRVTLGHILRVREGRPLVTLKLAETLDGYAAGDEHDPRLTITAAPANARTHVLRAQHAAIMIGIGTALADDPLMTVRGAGLEDRKPLRVVLDARLALSPRSRLATSAHETPVLLLASAEADAARAKILHEAGVEISPVALDAEGRVDLKDALIALAQRGITRVFSEGGPRVGAALIAQGLADEVVIFTAPKPHGRGTLALSQKARAILDDPTRYALVEDTKLGIDRMRRYERV
ncbi:MAG: bifunctional diaminohydroxyphosphoribosylaminopyrimidine deaminase/5-amino-6-(5-phosphoribosylamino)uracil reductase RibD [Rhodoblastus sp.]|nr:bifunctional diaminohydroxyphosphoribosylaminopyrimidine deaminase/5-amino-6-(5-phosphoribosylamino)uracil reductase RibD [Rhodoblastus sp.]